MIKIQHRLIGFSLLLLASLSTFADEFIANDNEIKSEATTVIDSIQKPKISIVIDDLGNNSIIAKQLLSLPATMTAAILPKTPQSKLISEFAFEQGHDIIMHLPMEAFSRPDLLGEGALLANMDQQSFADTFNQDAKSLPRIIGFNNHMGSLLTEDTEKMKWLMAQAKIKQLFFLDSKTSEDSIAEYIALTHGVPTISRDVFLDHNKDLSALKKQLALLKKIAKRKGKAVIICHPYPETLAFLKDNIEALNEEFELVGISELIFENNNVITKVSSLKNTP